MLLEHGADVNATYGDGESAIFALVESPGMATLAEQVAAKVGVAA